MRISAAPSHRIPNLLRFLRDQGYCAQEVDYGVIEVDLEDAKTLEEPFKLSRRLNVWNAVNRGEARLQ